MKTTNKLGAFVTIQEDGLSVLPYCEVMESAMEEGVRDEVFPEGWEDEIDYATFTAKHPSQKGVNFEIRLFLVPSVAGFLDPEDNFTQFVLKDIAARIAFNCMNIDVLRSFCYGTHTEGDIFPPIGDLDDIPF